MNNSSLYNEYVKRIVDMTVSLLLFIILLPLLIMVAIFIRFDSFQNIEI